MKSYKIISYPAMTLLSSKNFDQDKPVYPRKGYTGTWGKKHLKLAISFVFSH